MVTDDSCGQEHCLDLEKVNSGMLGVGFRTVMCAWQYQTEPAACITEVFSGNAWLPMFWTFGFRDQG